jgi:hypothetical protein
VPGDDGERDHRLEHPEILGDAGGRARAEREVRMPMAGGLQVRGEALQPEGLGLVP